MDDQLPFALLLLVATILVMRSSHAHGEPDNTPAHAPPALAALPNDTPATRLYHLQRSHINSIYFLPDSDQFDDSAREAIIDIALRLHADSRLNVVLVAYTDDVTDGEDAESLRTSRAEVVARALMGAGVDPNRISRSTNLDDQAITAPCSSEYCRQSYRRVAILFARSSRK